MAQFKTYDTIGTKEDVSSVLDALKNPKPWVEPAAELQAEVNELEDRLEQLKDLVRQALLAVTSYENRTAENLLMEMEELLDAKAHA